MTGLHISRCETHESSRPEGTVHEPTTILVGSPDQGNSLVCRLEAYITKKGGFGALVEKGAPMLASDGLLMRIAFSVF